MNQFGRVAAYVFIQSLLVCVCVCVCVYSAQCRVRLCVQCTV